MFKRLKNKLIYRLLDLEDNINDPEEERLWLAAQWERPELKSYIRFRDVILLKNIAQAIEKRDFQTALELNGRRCEILRLGTIARKNFEALKGKKK